MSEPIETLISFVRIGPGYPQPSGIYLHSEHLAQWFEQHGGANVAAHIRRTAAWCDESTAGRPVKIEESGVLGSPTANL